MPLYLSFIDLYLRDDYNRYYEDTTQRANSSYTAHQLKLIDKVSDSEIIKSLLAYHVVSQQVDYEGYKDYDDYWSTFESICTNKALLDQLNDKLLNWNHLRRGSMAKDFIAENMDGDSLSLSAFKGKWIYVDVWASWCNPCIAEIPTLKALEEKMHENNIVFMSVSVDKTREPWRKMVVDKDLKGVQLWAGDNDVLKEFYRVTGIPRFMIIDPEGNIYESSAKRPSSNVEKVLLGLEGI
jgi:thiol-disulfide isomerase/thioredoxin